MSLIIALADAVAAELNAAPAGTFDPALAAVRRVLPEFELADLAERKVSVVPKAVEISGSTRSACQFDLQVDIGVQKKLAPGSQDLDTQVAALCGLMDQIAAYLRKRPLAAVAGAAWVRTQSDPAYAPEHLAQQRVFTSVLTVTYRMLA